MSLTEITAPPLKVYCPITIKQPANQTYSALNISKRSNPMPPAPHPESLYDPTAFNGMCWDLCLDLPIQELQKYLDPSFGIGGFLDNGGEPR